MSESTLSSSYGESDSNSSLSYLLDDVLDRMPEELHRREEDEEKEKLKKYLAARAIQRWVRGFITRLHLLHLNAAATVIQCHWRGHLGRKLYRQMLKNRAEELCHNYYNEKATLIQKIWRGYYVRKNLLDFYKFKAWLNEVEEKNDIVVYYMKELYEEQSLILKAKEEEDAFVKALYTVFKLHHFLRTTQLPGIYSLPDGTELSELEVQLTLLKYKDYVLAQRKEIKQEKRYYQPPKELFEKWFSYWSKNIYKIKNDLKANNTDFRDFTQRLQANLRGKTECATPMETETGMKPKIQNMSSLQ